MEAKNIKKPSRSVLGRGLSALISTVPVPIAPHRMAPADHHSLAAQNVQNTFGAPSDIELVQFEKNEEKRTVNANGVTFIEVDKIVNNPKQPRQEFNQSELSELAESIKTLGVLQPVLLRRVKGDGLSENLEIVAGERRWRASQVAGLKQIPTIILDLDDRQALEIALVENIQRSNLSPIEEALAYERLTIEFSLSQKDIAERVGKDRASIANYLRLLKLPKEVQDLLKEAKITMGHAKAIMTISEPTAQISLARKVIEEGLSVRALEAITARVVVLNGIKKKHKNAASSDAGGEITIMQPLVDKLREALGTKVSIKHQSNGKGKIEIDYFSDQELERIVDHVCR